VAKSNKNLIAMKKVTAIVNLLKGKNKINFAFIIKKPLFILVSILFLSSIRQVTHGQCTTSAFSNGTICAGSTLNLSSSTTVTPLEFVKIAGGSLHSLGIKSDGTLWAWGNNSDGQLGGGYTNVNWETPVQVGTANNWTEVACGELHCLALKSDGSLWAWGSNYYGQVGNGSTNSYIPIPVQVSGLTSGVTAISAGTSHSLAIVNGAVKSWGLNTRGQLGDGTIIQRNSPVQVSGLTSGVTVIDAGGYHSLAIVNGSVKSWGYNINGQLGDGTTTQRKTPVQVVGLTSGITAIAAGGSHSLAIINGSAKSWGYNNYGQLGDSTTTQRTAPVQVTNLTTGVTAIDAGLSHSLTIVNGSAKSWGNNNYGQLGNNSHPFATSQTQISGLTTSVTAIAAGGGHSLAIVNGTAKSWGRGGLGQLGEYFGGGIGTSSPIKVRLSMLTYSWSGPNGFSSIEQNPNITSTTTANAGTYTVTASADRCSASASILVTINPIPLAPSASDQSFCGSTTVSSLLPAASSTINWFTTPSGGVALTPSTAISSGSYYVSETNIINGCEGPRTRVNIIIKSLPTTEVSANNDGTLCAGTTLNLNSTATASPLEFIKIANGLSNSFSFGIKSDGTLLGMGFK
jgi:trimeric autotransporter adhesin